MARPNLTQHRKFRRLARSLGSVIMARGSLELLWDSCYDSGEDYIGTSDDIENLVGWQGDRGVLTTALAQAGAPEGFGFIEPIPDTASGAVSYRVHDLWHHAPDYVAKRRQRELARQEKSAPERRLGADRRTAPNGADLSESPNCQDEVDVTPAPAPAPALAPRKETSTETSSVPAFLAFPVIGPHAGDWTLTDAQVAHWVSLFPGLDVRAECRKALAWVGANPRNRKTAKGMASFLVRWLTRAVDNGRSRLAPQQPGATVLRSVAPECPHDPPCAAPGRWACQQKSALEAARRQA